MLMLDTRVKMTPKMSQEVRDIDSSKFQISGKCPATQA
jgi:hypothetical protein